MSESSNMAKGMQLMAAKKFVNKMFELDEEVIE
jgi:hypothetical protein